MVLGDADHPTTQTALIQELVLYCSSHLYLVCTLYVYNSLSLFQLARKRNKQFSVQEVRGIIVKTVRFLYLVKCVTRNLES
jgi:hypothetical protein